MKTEYFQRELNSHRKKNVPLFELLELGKLLNVRVLLFESSNGTYKIETNKTLIMKKILIDNHSHTNLLQTTSSNKKLLFPPQIL